MRGASHGSRSLGAYTRQTKRWVRARRSVRCAACGLLGERALRRPHEPRSVDDPSRGRRSQRCRLSPRWRSGPAGRCRFGRPKPISARFWAGRPATRTAAHGHAFRGAAADASAYLRRSAQPACHWRHPTVIRAVILVALGFCGLGCGQAAPPALPSLPPPQYETPRGYAPASGNIDGLPSPDSSAPRAGTEAPSSGPIPTGGPPPSAPPPPAPPAP